jgi:hypothetical protein
VIPVKTTANGSFRFEARNGSNGALMWTANSDYVVPRHNWFPSFNIALTSTVRLYAASRAQLDVAITISTPLTVDATGTWIAASTAAADTNIDRVAMNSAPALSRDGSAVYIAVSNAQGQGYLLSLSSNSTSSPTVGPDGDVYFGVLEDNRPAHNFRG